MRGSWMERARAWGVLAGMALLAGCSTGMEDPFEDDAGWAASGVAASEVAAVERLGFNDVIDGVRLENGAGTLELNDQLNQASQDYAEVLAETPGELSHIDAEGRGPGDRAAAAGYDYDYVAENLAYGPATNEEAVEAWMDSPPHRRTMINPDVDDLGLGREGATWVMMVGRQN